MLKATDFYDYCDRLSVIVSRCASINFETTVLKHEKSNDNLRIESHLSKRICERRLLTLHSMVSLLRFRPDILFYEEKELAKQP